MHLGRAMSPTHDQRNRPVNIRPKTSLIPPATDDESMAIVSLPGVRRSQTRIDKLAKKYDSKNDD